jgi:C-terminal processing protease CtpA/Prc
MFPSFTPYRVRAVAALVLLVAPIAFVQGAPVSSANVAASTTVQKATRIERLAALARLWGEAKYFHPSLAYRDIDWDRALVETIPRVNAATGARDDQVAIEHLLAALGDDGSYVEAAAKPPIGAAVGAKIDMQAQVRMEGATLHVQLARMGEAFGQQADWKSIQQAKTLITGPLPHTSAMVIDLREDHEVAQDFASIFYSYLFKSLIQDSTDRAVTLGTLRYRRYNGFVAQGDVPNSSHDAGLVSERPARIVGTSKSPLPPTVVLVNRFSPDLGEFLSGMQSAGLIAIVAEGSGVVFGRTGRTVEMTDGIKVHLRTVELLAPDGSVGMHPDLAVADGKGDSAIATALDRLRSRRVAGAQAAVPAVRLVGGDDDAYPQMPYPAAEYRLLALFRFWNVIEHFYPYKSLIGGSWDDVLLRYIPQFEADKDLADYQLSLLQLVAELHDSHGFLDGDIDASKARLGDYVPPAQLGYVNGNTVVLHVLADGTGLRAGDRIDTVDGQPIAGMRAGAGRYISASTQQSLDRSVNRAVLRGAKDSAIRLGVTGMDGAKRGVDLARSMSRGDPHLYASGAPAASAGVPEKPAYRVLADGFGYVDLDNLKPADVDAMFAAIDGTRATIFDMRGYPNGTARSIATRLTRRPDVVGALMWSPMPDGKSEADPDSADAIYAQSMMLPAPQGKPYLGKVVVLINERAISQAEHLCLYLEAATPATFIGTPTAGANGDVVELKMPGGLAVGFTGLGIRHADGRQLQRMGIQPDIRVEPTLQGLVSGQDEILEAAMGYLEKNRPVGR